MTRSTLAVVCLVVVGSVAGSSASAAPGDVFPEEFLDLLSTGQRVMVVPVKDTSAFELHIISRPLPANVRAERMRTVVARGRDYVSLRSDQDTLHIPAHAIRSIVDGSFDVLERPVTLQFNRAPLREAIDTLSKAIDVPIRIDGEALKMDGYTQNMPVSASLKDVPARRLLTMIQQEQPGLILAVFDDHFRLTTRTVAKRDKLEFRDVRDDGPRR